MNETDHAGEQLSSLVDGELTNADLDRAFEAISRDPDRKRRWTRYHVAVDAMKKSLPRTMAPSNFADRIAQAIETEPAILAPYRRPLRISPLRKQLAGLAVAASVGVMAVLGVQSMRSEDVALPVAQAPAVVAAPIAVSAGVPTAPTSTASTTIVAASDARTPVPAQIQSQLHRYLLNHNQSAFGAPGMLPYARIVSHSGGDPTE